MAEPTGRTRYLIAAIGGGLAAVIAVGGIWLAVRGSDDVDVTSSTTTAEETSTTATSDGAGTEVTEPETTEPETTDSTTIDDVPLSDLPAGAPDTFVAVTADTFELVRVDSRTGEILAELGSWGLGGGDGELLQALQTVELAPDGTIYVDDCCEPAYGSTFVVTDSFDPDTTPRIDGIGPEVSLDGSRLARSDRGSAVAIEDGAGTVLGSFGSPDYSGTVATTPLTWIDNNTLVVSEYDLVADSFRLKVLDVSDPAAPTVLTERSDPGRLYAAADVRADGNILVVVRLVGPSGEEPSEEEEVFAEIIDPSTGDTIADFDLPNDVYEANYDASGRFVLTARSNGQLDWYGAGQRGTLGTGFISADW